MSIWSSVTALDGTLDPDGDLDGIPERDEYNADNLADGSTYSIDVATTWHECVRLTIDTNVGTRRGTEKCSAWLILNEEEVDALIRCLQFARGNRPAVDGGDGVGEGER